MKFILYWLLLVICFVLSFMHLYRNPLEDLRKIADNKGGSDVAGILGCLPYGMTPVKKKYNGKIDFGLENN